MSPNTHYWGVAIPGLAMNSSELPSLPGLFNLQNPEIGSAPAMPRQYTLADVAEAHLATLLELIRREELPAKGFTVLGISMGAMIASYLASRFRSHLPGQMIFGFLVTSPNLASNPAVPGPTLDLWLKTSPANIPEFERVLATFFAPAFVNAMPHVVRQYAEYRAAGGNQQTPRAFYRQLSALRLFNGEETFPHVAPSEAVFIGAAQDQIFGPRHNGDLRSLNPRARHIEINGLGHLVNIERPTLFDPRKWAHL